MTERFTIDYVAETIDDTEDTTPGGVTYYDCSDERIEDLCTLLNNLNDEINELQDKVKMLKLQTYCQDQYINKLEKEQQALLEQSEKLLSSP